MVTPPARSPQLVRDLMRVGVPTCAPDTTIDEIAQLLLTQGLESLVVLDVEDGHALGIVSQQELIKAYGKGQGAKITAEDIMSDGVPQVPPDIPLIAAAQIMQDLGVRILYLMHHSGGIEYPAAYISYEHLLRHMCAASEDELRDLGIKAERIPPADAFIQRRDQARRKNIE